MHGANNLTRLAERRFAITLINLEHTISYNRFLKPDAYIKLEIVTLSAEECILLDLIIDQELPQHILIHHTKTDREHTEDST